MKGNERRERGQAARSRCRVNGMQSRAEGIGLQVRQALGGKGELGGARVCGLAARAQLAAQAHAVAQARVVQRAAQRPLVARDVHLQGGGGW